MWKWPLWKLKQRSLNSGKNKAKESLKEMSSAGNSSSSHEDLLDENAFNHNVTRFGSIQPNKQNKSTFNSKSSQSSSHLYKKVSKDIFYGFVA